MGKSLFFFILITLSVFPTGINISAADWTALFDRHDGWLDADGIFSIPLDGNDALGSATPETKTLFVFSDTIVGTADPETRKYKDVGMVSHSAALLTGNEPDPTTIRFVYGKNGDGSRSNMFGVHTWLQDGLVVDGTVCLIGLRPGKEDWKPVGLDLIEIPLDDDGWPDWSKFKRTPNVPILLRTEKEHVNFGIGVTDLSAVDGFVYVYGYRDDLATHAKSLVAARVPKKSYRDFSRWTFWNGRDWSPKIESVLNVDAVLAERVSCELSVTPLPDGRFILVYSRDSIGPVLEYRVGKSPIGPFDEPVPFFETPEPKQLGNGIYTYNAKAHPHLSAPGTLLVSYNVNRMGGLPRSIDEYRPRFVTLEIPRNEEPGPVVPTP